MRKSFPWPALENKDQLGKRRLRAGTQIPPKKVRVRCTINTMSPMVNTTLTLILGKRRSIWSNALQSFQDLGDIVTAIKAHGCVIVLTGGNVVVRGKAEGPKCSGMVSTFITQISTHSMDRWHANASCTCVRAWIVPKQTPTACSESQKIHVYWSRATGPRGPRKDNASTIAVISAVLLEWVLAPERARWASVVTTGPNMIWNLPWRDREITLHPARVSPLTTRVPPSVR